MSATIPKLSELQGLVKDSLVCAPVFVAASVGIKDANPGTTEKSVVVIDAGTASKTIESHLRTRGICIVVEPIVGGKKRDQSGPAWILDCEIMVKVLINPERNDRTDEGGAGVNAMAAVNEVIEAMTRQKYYVALDPPRNRRHPGGEFFNVGGRETGEAFSLSQFDPGLLAYDVMFTKEATTL